MTDKKSLRHKLIKDRLAISPEDWQSRSLAICNRLASLPLVTSARKIALYKSFRNEVDLSPLMALAPEKSYYFPRTELEQNQMEFLRYDALRAFQTNRWGLTEPASGEPLTIDEETVIIVPALAFDRKGHRLGYGKGYYDRFLSSTKVATIGVCFSEFFFDALPAEVHDRALDYVVTELGSLAVSIQRPC